MESMRSTCLYLEYLVGREGEGARTHFVRLLFYEPKIPFFCCVVVSAIKVGGLFLSLFASRSTRVPISSRRRGRSGPKFTCNAHTCPTQRHRDNGLLILGKGVRMLFHCVSGEVVDPKKKALGPRLESILFSARLLFMPSLRITWSEYY